MLPVAVDAMGGDDAPGPILAGAHRAAASGIPVVLVGPGALEARSGDVAGQRGLLRLQMAEETVAGLG